MKKKFVLKIPYLLLLAKMYIFHKISNLAVK